MIVNFQPPAVGEGDPPSPICLAQGLAERESPTNIRQRVDRAVQVVAPMRAPTRTPLDRANRLVNYSFSVTRSFATAEDAHQFTVDHPAELDCAGGNVPYGVLQLESEAEGSDFTRELQKAVCQSVDLAQMGVSVVISYSFLGSEWTVPEEEGGG